MSLGLLALLFNLQVGDRIVVYMYDPPLRGIYVDQACNDYYEAHGVPNQRLVTAGTSLNTEEIDALNLECCLSADVLPEPGGC